jgi:hypothetical protein
MNGEPFDDDEMLFPIIDEIFKSFPEEELRSPAEVSSGFSLCVEVEVVNSVEFRAESLICTPRSRIRSMCSSVKMCSLKF